MQFRILVLAAVAALMVVSPVLAANATESFDAAATLYSQSVDLANAGKYQQALDAADKALALNSTSMTGLIQSNRAGILVMLNRNDEAIAAADAALAVEGNLTTVHSIAWYNKGNALYAQGKMSEAKAAYAKASELDPTLVSPVKFADTESPVVTTVTGVSQSPSSAAVSVQSTAPATVPTTARSPVPVTVILGALFIAFACCRYGRSG
ncbi:tetratricopeptide repeat protein [Methanoregula sp.]|uniref:tetratricopeptide repeat protein n=1 Tax=Methanoregula sp. TaxID=2052170 RepID=UPI002371683F|nr:tetratricopeptide repeat protein [Methanoregula sp.]MDD1686861.1 tetratricopeptide repeat protein [Methanoregula sp.]